MPVYDILRLLGFGFGTALTAILFSLSMQRTPKRAVDVAFGVLFVSFILWFGGQVVAILIDLLFGSVAQLEMQIFVALAYLGLAVTPSSLLHIQLASLFLARNLKKPLSKRQTLLVVLLYMPVVLFVALNFHHIWDQQGMIPGQTRNVHTPFLLWMILCIIASITFSEKLINTLRFDADRRFYRDISYVLAAIGFGVILVYVFSFYRLPYVGPYLDLIMLLSPAIPMGVLLYYVYRYNFYRLVVKPSLVYSIIYGLLMAIYLLGIRRFGEYLKQFPEVNAEIIEGLLLVALVFAFQPFRTAFQNRLDKWFFRDRYYYQQFLRELSDSISGIVDLGELLQALRRALISTLKVKECTIVILHIDHEQIKIVQMSGNTGFYDISLLVQSLNATKDFHLNRQNRDYRVTRALQENQFAVAVPVYFQDKMQGIICLSEKESGNEFTDEEFDLLQTFSNQIGLAIENARLVQERVELLGRVYQSEKLNSLGQLATTMSHEIKNPLSSIKTIVQVLHEKATGEDKQDLRVVVDEIDRLNVILQQLLSFARPAVATTEKVSVADVARDVVSLLKHQAGKNNIDLKLQMFDPIHPISVRIQSIREVVFNLVLNAIQALQAGGEITVQVMNADFPKTSPRRLTIKQKNKRRAVLLVVSDNGPGIPEDIRKTMYEPFYTSKTVGTGLGLAIVKRNVDELGGVIQVETGPATGTTFSVFFPETQPDSQLA